jgi:hypothetical protein
MSSFEAKFQLQSNFGASMPIALHDQRTTIGRDAQSSIVIDEPNMPPLLGVVIESMDEYYLIADQELIPFTVNGVPTLRKILNDGDSIDFDQCQLIFLRSPKPARATDSLKAIGHELTKIDRSLDNPIEIIDMLATKSASPAKAAIEATGRPNHNEMNLANLDSTQKTTIDWPNGSWAALIYRSDPTKLPIYLFKPITIVEFNESRALVSRRNEQIHVSLISGVVFCSRIRLGTKPQQLHGDELIASGQHIYQFKRSPAL